MKKKLIYAIVILFAVIGVLVCSPALLVILIPVGILVLFMCPIICLLQKHKIAKLTIEIDKKK